MVKQRFFVVIDMENDEPMEPAAVALFLTNLDVDPTVYIRLSDMVYDLEAGAGVFTVGVSDVER